MTKELKHSIAVFLLTFSSLTIYAQSDSLIGLWAVEKVTVGEEIMTPVAKWTRISADGSFQAGNGWLQNSKGHWSYDSKNNIYSATDSLTIANKFGGFKVSFAKEKMYWQRVEEGMPVKVTLVPIEQLPMSPADYLQGVWELVQITENSQSALADSVGDGAPKFFFRWDRVYIYLSPQGERFTGYWHIHGHKPQITLLPHQGMGKSESWKIEVNKTELLMTGISESNNEVERKYVRRNSF